MRKLCLLVLAASAASGQFRNLATVDDGSFVVFSSSLQMTGTDQLPYDKLFLIDANGLRLYLQRDRQNPRPDQYPPVTNAYQLEGADFSGDGSVSVVIGLAECAIGGSSCFVSASKYRSEVTGLARQGQTVWYGQMRISRNGRYALTCCDQVSPPPPKMLIDFATGRSKTVAGQAPDLSPRRIIASTGTVVLPSGGNSVYVQDFDKTVEVPTSAKPLQAVIDDAARTVVYASDGWLARVDIASGKETRIVEASAPKLIGLSNDGSAVAYLTGGQLYVIDSAGQRQITRDPAGITEATMSGNGAVAYAATGGGGILKIDVASGTATELIGRLATLESPNSNALPQPIAGSAFCVNGTGLADTTVSAAPPLPASLGGLQILLDGKPLPLLNVAPAAACFQVPWDTTIGDHTLTAVTAAPSPFAPKQQATLSVLYPSFVDPVPFGEWALAAHQDFSALVSPDDPAVPGEIVNFYMTGLGPVDPPVATGAPAPANPPAAATLPFACSFSDFVSGQVPADVLYAGLAPGFTGYYQVSVRLPSPTPVTSGRALIRCWAGADWAGESAWIPVAP